VVVGVVVVAVVVVAVVFCQMIYHVPSLGHDDVNLNLKMTIHVKAKRMSVHRLDEDEDVNMHLKMKIHVKEAKESAAPSHTRKTATTSLCRLSWNHRQRQEKGTRCDRSNGGSMPRRGGGH